MSFNKYVILVLSLFSISAFGKIELVSKSSTGNGCPASAPAEILLTEDNATFSVLFTGMDTRADGPRAEQRKKCDVFVQFKIPNGMQLEFSAVDYNGFMGLDAPSAWGYVNNISYFVNGTVVLPNGMRRASTDLTAPILRFYQQGPLNDNFFWKADYAGKAQRLISTCNGSAVMKIKTEVISSNGPEGGSSFVTMDSVDGQFSQVYKLGLRPCEKR